MTERAVIRGNYADLKFIKTRSVCQIIIEVPIEQGAEIVGAFGAPLPGAEVPVAIARIDPEAKREPERRPFNTLPYPQQAALACQSEPFWTFLRETRLTNVQSETDAATAVRNICNVNSRADLKPNNAAGGMWKSLYREYQAWLDGPHFTPAGTLERERAA